MISEYRTTHSIKTVSYTHLDVYKRQAQVSLINEKFINKHKHRFNKTPIVPVNNTMVTTATGDTQIICKQALISIITQGIQIEVADLIVNNLVYDVILGTDTLRKIHATIDFSNKKLTCTIRNKLYTVKFRSVDSDLKQAEQCTNCLLYTSRCV